MNETANKPAIAASPIILPPGHPLRRKILRSLVAVSLGNLCFITPWFSQLYDRDFGFYNSMPVTWPSLLALAANILWVALLAWLAMVALRRFQTRWLHLALHLLFIFLWVFPLDFCRVKVFSIADYEVLVFVKQPWVLLSLLALLAVIVWQHQRVARYNAVLVGILSPLAFLTLGRIALLCLGLEQLAQQSGQPLLRPQRPVREGQPRVVWIIFDEMDYRLAFDQRPAGVHLPEFDHLRSEVLFATNAYPPGGSTSLSVPALTTGCRVADAAIRNASDLTLKLADTNGEVAWSEMPSVFTSARDLGLNAAVVGWFFPYDRVLGAALNYCTWYAYPPFESTRAPTFGKAMLRELSSLTGTLHLRRLNMNLYRSSIPASITVVTNSSYGLIFLHLPMPHTPGVYNPEKGRFTFVPTSRAMGYINNLALTDRALGQLRHAMEESGQWDKTWLLVSADHSWRASRVFDGKRDLRVPFLLKGPGKGRSIIYSPQFNTVLTHDLILAILRGELTSQDGAVAWLDAHPRAEPTVMGTGSSESER